jgi:hypothetical protein
MKGVRHIHNDHTIDKMISRRCRKAGSDTEIVKSMQECQESDAGGRVGAVIGGGIIMGNIVASLAEHRDKKKLLPLQGPLTAEQGDIMEKWLQIQKTWKDDAKALIEVAILIAPLLLFIFLSSRFSRTPP